jgi:hypothetical protein
VFGNILSDQRPTFIWRKVKGLTVLRVCHFYGVRISFILINHYVISDALWGPSDYGEHDLLSHTRRLGSFGFRVRRLSDSELEGPHRNGSRKVFSCLLALLAIMSHLLDLRNQLFRCAFKPFAGVPESERYNHFYFSWRCAVLFAVPASFGLRSLSRQA